VHAAGSGVSLDEESGGQGTFDGHCSSGFEAAFEEDDVLLLVVGDVLEV
jgi:hypothetical protein